MLDPFFADTANGRRFAIATRPRAECCGGVLFVPPFAEEMNKSRRMAALAARAMADKGWQVLRFDLFGTGDSEGDFGEATWSDWLEDIAFWVNWLKDRSDGPIVLWGLRAGALLATDWLMQTEANLPLMLWQPVTGGQQHLNQFLRLRAAAEMLDAHTARGVVAGLKSQLADGSPVEVAGYNLNPELVNPMASVRLGLPAGYDANVSIQEIIPNAEASPTPAIAKLTDTWRDSGIAVDLDQVAGPAFWRTVEIETLPQLIDATVMAIRKLAP